MFFKFSSVLVSFLASLQLLAIDCSFKLPGERWIANASGYICGAYGNSSVQPKSHEQFNVSFENIVTDRSLDNGLITATFKENGSLCQYKVLLFADNEAQTIKYVDSGACSLDGTSSCQRGKALLDQQFALNDYLYWGHPHHLSIMIPEESAKQLCDASSSHIGVDFTVSGRLDD